MKKVHRTKKRYVFSPSFKHEDQQMKNWLTAVAVTCTHKVHFPVLLLLLVAVLLNKKFRGGLEPSH